MPNTSNSAGASSVREASATAAHGVRAVLQRSVLDPLRFLAFWASILLPLTYLPLLHGGITGSELTVLAALLVANVVALIVGHGYRNEPGS
jgi:hypothetical protein